MGLRPFGESCLRHSGERRGPERRPASVLRRRWGIAGLAVLLATGSGAGQSAVVTHQAREVSQGELILLSVTAPDPITSVEASAFGRPVQAFRGDRPQAWHALVAVDLDAVPGLVPIRLAIRTVAASMSIVHGITVSAKAFGTRRLSVDPRFVTPPASALGRIDREQRRLGALLAAVSTPRLWSGDFVAPVDGPPAGNFGQRSVFNGQPRGSHRGGDFGSPAGAPVRSPARGRVIMAEDLYYSGHTVVVDHGLGLFSLLAHLSHIDVSVGDMVEQGGRVGAVGATGRVTGPHLHWTVRLGSAAVDPLSLLALKGMPR